jgi:hypothetical protein
VSTNNPVYKEGEVNGESRCEISIGKEQPINDGRCIKGRAGAESINFYNVNKDRTICLVKYTDDNCDLDEKKVLQDFVFVKEGKSLCKEIRQRLTVSRCTVPEDH